MFTKKDLCECAWRELQKRRNFYPKFISAGKMKQVDADREIAKMEAVYRVLCKLDDSIFQQVQQ